jgi:predicted nucleic acid-binding protein
MIVFLDTNILGLITNRNTAFDESQQCKKWFETLLIRGVRIVTSDICDYEVRRGLISSAIRSGQVSPGIGSLDSLRIDGLLEFLPVSTETLDLAANLWARASNEGLTTRDDKNIDVDIIISAQYRILEAEYSGQRVIVATTNLKHLSRFCDAARWQDIKL